MTETNKQTTLSYISSRVTSVEHFSLDFEIDYDGETQLFEEECRDFMNGFVRDIFAAE